MIERKANLLEEPLGCSTLKCGDSKSRCLRFSGLNEFTYGNDRTRDDKTFFKRATNIHYLSWKAMRLNRAQLSYQPELEAQTSYCLSNHGSLSVPRLPFTLSPPFGDQTLPRSWTMFQEELAELSPL